MLLGFKNSSLLRSSRQSLTRKILPTIADPPSLRRLGNQKMTIYSFYIFDRHCAAVYYQDWHRSSSKPARPSQNVLPWVSPAVSPPNDPSQPRNDADRRRQLTSAGILPFENRTGVVVGGGEVPTQLQSLVFSSVGKTSTAGLSAQPSRETHPDFNNSQRISLESQSQDKAKSTSQGLPFDEEVKLVYGVIFSLRNMVRKLAGKNEPLHCYTTSTYTLHLLTTPSNHTFALFTSPMKESLRSVLKNIWRTAWLDFVIRNPLISIDSNKSGRGIDNQMFRRAVDNQLRALPFFNQF
ncbi:hypothetical protein O181_104203 [Austropuccinia psidii MF-1]|uniref:Trafficking protein particle complex subunit n=1 Tax=Austropuccinia psidii MF-1 TaxID=1389203 RepID=A0A9Q3JJP7_9BASI|nr:hypothetical protein [Austropuccinia psidii MF-1]